MSEIIDKIKSRGYWEVIIRPANYLANHVSDISILFPLISKCAVAVRGWDYPHIGPKGELKIDKDKISQSVSFWEHNEYWALFQSGQFVHYCGFYEDWEQENPYYESHKRELSPGAGLNFLETLIRFTEIYELAARISMTEAGSDDMYISIGLFNLKDRVLFTADPGRFMRKGYSTDMLCYDQTFQIPREELISDSGRKALEAARNVFIRFKWEVSIERLNEIKNSLYFLKGL